MFAVRVTYLMGRVYSSIFEEGDFKQTPEWPPHPSRLFSALVSAWAEGGAEKEIRPALEWIERQPAPMIYASECDFRKTVQAFVPVNDKTTLPEKRDRKGRAFPSATLRHPEVYFAWEQTPPDEVASALNKIFLRTSSLGHSASLVSIEIARTPPDNKLICWRADAAGNARLRVPYSGRLADLISRYELFERDPKKIYRPSAGRTELYSAPKQIRSVGPQKSVRRDDHRATRFRPTGIPAIFAIRYRRAPRCNSKSRAKAGSRVSQRSRTR